jgi:hypothetical protein
LRICKPEVTLRTRTQRQDRCLAAIAAKSNGGWKRAKAMKTLTKFTTLSLLMSAIALACLANTAVAQQPATALTNLVAGVGGPVSQNTNWENYSALRGNYNLTAGIPVKLTGVSDPIISLTNNKVCPTQPISVANPCVVRLDPITLTPSTLSDYYFVVYYADDANNASVGAANLQFPITSLTGWFLTGDQSRLAVGDSIPAGYNGSHPYFLLYVMSN